MNLGAFPPLQFLEQFEKDRNKFFFVILLNSLLSHPVLNFFCRELFFIIITTDSTSLLVISLFRLRISGFSFGSQSPCSHEGLFLYVGLKTGLSSLWLDLLTPQGCVYACRPFILQSPGGGANPLTFPST